MLMHKDVEAEEVSAVFLMLVLPIAFIMVHPSGEVLEKLEEGHGITVIMDFIPVGAAFMAFYLSHISAFGIMGGIIVIGMAYITTITMEGMNLSPLRLDIG